MNLSAQITTTITSDDYIFGFADLDGLLIGKYASYRYGISIVRKLDPSIIDGIITAGAPTPEYYCHYNETNEEIASTVQKVAGILSSLGIDNFPIQPTAHDNEVDKTMNDTLSFGFSHKMCATRSGLGWIGKTDLFISETYGPRVRLSSILTNHPLPQLRPPIDKSRCGTCSLCVTTCPAQAATGALWNAATPRESFYDAQRCREKCRALTRKHIGTDESLCGICVAVCPAGRKARRDMRSHADSVE
ncbi:MAG TPA: 4Fe-4S double cluster binding domain-containing protein [Spirochaetota bacterium]